MTQQTEAAPGAKHAPADSKKTASDLYRFKQSAINVNKWSKRLSSLVRAVLLIGMSFVILYPILLKVSTSFKTLEDLTNPTVMWIPERFSLENYKLAIDVMGYFSAIRNSFTLSAVTTILQTLSCAMAGYAFAKLPFRGINILFAGVILTILVPPQTILVPSYVNFKSFDLFGLFHLIFGDGINMLDTYWPFVLMAITGNALKSGLFIYIFRQFFRGISKEIEEAAFVDGAGVFKSFVSIMLPNAIPAMVTVMLFAFVWQWNDTFFSSNFLPSMNTLTNATLGFPYKVNVMLGATNQVDPFYASMLVDTGLLLSILPLIVMYLFVQRYFVESIDRTGLVG
ncbi:carbohydrate ABC transporter permease [Cohnella thailandensis]|uniref:Carbohydrate ABC transporter permease n=1 Tax=Cohnella thailandensis TaxID=557557 RepID=A0A841T052_9BACL|nr:carbohydrate ABC transporter permease [Cohnella thailandensis]MBB6637813.1 carbohydrate ABC transporter permease [Cohnella thailandensis]MBP1974007.1 multiple sugar transport system permease protein [Cohnella thailandensis]